MFGFGLEQRLISLKRSECTSCMCVFYALLCPLVPCCLFIGLCVNKANNVGPNYCFWVVAIRKFGKGFGGLYTYATFKCSSVFFFLTWKKVHD